MSANSPAASGENKPVIINNDNKSGNNHGRRGNNNSQRRDGQIKKEKFLGADPNLQGYVFEAKTLQAEQVANFEKVDARIRDQIGMDYHLSVLESIENGSKTGKIGANASRGRRGEYDSGGGDEIQGEILSSSQPG